RTGGGPDRVELEVSAWTRRDRLERIARAERDRRAGRVDLALASLGEASEWPARLVLALAKLPGDEGADARAILESTLDDWAAETGLDALDPAAAEAAPEAEAKPEVDEDVAPEDEATSDGEALVVDAVDTLEEDLLSPAAGAAIAPRPAASVLDDSSATVAALAAPIESDELERAFAEAEAQTEEMHGVNDVAERILMDEPLDLAELDGGVPVPLEDAEDEAGREISGWPQRETDAAFAEAPIWPEPIAPDAPVASDAAPNGSAEAGVDASGEASARTQVITTLERWLDNIRAGRAQ
ncbi:MAG: hypothetical protein AAGC67_21550, partial [Myxococcota bacterium]